MPDPCPLTSNSRRPVRVTALPMYASNWLYDARSNGSARQTGIPIRQNMAHNLGSATLQVVVERRDHSGPQRLGDDERYSLTAGNGHVRISADEPLGALRGIETFLELVQPSSANQGAGFSIAGVQIEDEPRFGWRGLSLDVSRHFIPFDGVLRTLDGMAAVKLNVFPLARFRRSGFPHREQEISTTPEIELRWPLLHPNRSACGDRLCPRARHSGGTGVRRAGPRDELVCGISIFISGKGPTRLSASPAY